LTELTIEKEKTDAEFLLCEHRAPQIKRSNFLSKFAVKAFDETPSKRYSDDDKESKN